MPFKFFGDDEKCFRLCHFSCCAFFSYLTLMNYLASEDILKENILAKLIDCMNWHWSMNPSIMPSPYTKGAQDGDDDHLAIFLLNIQIFQLNVNFRFAIPHSDNKRHLTAAGLQQQFNDVSISSTHYLTTSSLYLPGPWPAHRVRIVD